MDIASYDVAVAVTTSDSATNDFRAFMVSANGNVAIEDRRGNAVTVVAVAGTVYPIHTAKIKVTGTTATGIIGLN